MFEKLQEPLYEALVHAAPKVREISADLATFGTGARLQFFPDTNFTYTKSINPSCDCHGRGRGQGEPEILRPCTNNSQL